MQCIKQLPIGDRSEELSVDWTCLAGPQFGRASVASLEHAGDPLGPADQAQSTATHSLAPHTPGPLPAGALTLQVQTWEKP